MLCIENSISHQTNIEKQLKYEKSVYDVKSFFAEKYGIKIPFFDINIQRKKLLQEKSIIHKCKVYITKIIKALIPYGIIKILKKRKES